MAIPSREIIAHCHHNPVQIADHLGEPDYSYAFVLATFLPVLETLGPVQVVHDVAEIDAACGRARDAGREPVLFSFAPPHRLPGAAECLTVPVFAWEFDAIPDEAWSGDERQNWASVLARHPGCITHSRFAAAAVLKSLGADYRVCSLPAPVWDAFATLPDTTWTGSPHTLRYTGAVVDSHTLAMDREPTFEPIEFATGPQELSLSGLVFTTIANPGDGRKNWREQLTAFAWTFRDDPQATLVFKAIHHDAARVCADVLLELRRLAPFRCRIVAILGYLEDAAFADLIRATTFVVNASRGEGQCLPLMEFMSAGTPAVSPSHTAMADYVHADNACLVRTSSEWTYWPHDPRRKLRCLSERLDWDSLCEAFAAAARTARDQPDRYAAMAGAARNTLEQHCSRVVIERALATFLTDIHSVDSATT